EKRGCIESLLHVNIDSAGDVAHFGSKFLGNEVISLLVRANNRHVNGCGSAKIQNLRDDVCWLEEKLHAGKSLRECAAKLANIFAGALAALLLQLNQNFRVRRAYGAG